MLAAVQSQNLQVTAACVWGIVYRDDVGCVCVKHIHTCTHTHARTHTHNTHTHTSATARRQIARCREF
jgi:hypothetical protein